MSLVWKGGGGGGYFGCGLMGVAGVGQVRFELFELGSLRVIAAGEDFSATYAPSSLGKVKTPMNRCLLVCLR
jgi:hypothetical protein